MMDSSSNNRNFSSKDFDRHFPITIIKDSNLQLSLPSTSPQHQLSSAITIAIWKDKRLDQLDISKELIEILHINGFTIERILEYGPSKIAEILGIDEFFAQIIINGTLQQQNQLIIN